MKIYTVTSLGCENGEAYAFKSRKAAERKRAELRREADEDLRRNRAEGNRVFIGREQVFQVHILQFPITADGIIAAYEAGAADVPK